MKVGFIGLGKLGLPVALAAEDRGHEVYAWDRSPGVIAAIRERRLPSAEQDVRALLRRTQLRLIETEDVVKAAELVFIAVQTPHEPELGGASRLPSHRSDFDYSHLRDATAVVAAGATMRHSPVTVAVISTVLPGTIEREVKPLLPANVTLAYNPFFTAMGTTVRDFLNPELVLVGVDRADQNGSVALLERFYRTLHNRPVFNTDVRTAELIKLAYNTFVGQKIVFANTMMELSHRLGADVDSLTQALSLADQRIISPRYLTGGMGDGGPCHPRDNVALSWLARELGLSRDIFGEMMVTRERQTEWLADLIESHAESLPIVILGKAFKPGTPLVDGSPGLLLASILRERGLQFTQLDHYVDGGEPEIPQRPSLFFIATRHPEYRQARFPAGSVVLDPWGYVPDRASLEVVRIGRSSS
jgi:UDPglucose 6-dehydrogenase